MAIIATLNGKDFGVGDSVKVHQTVTEGDKKRTQVFAGIVIKIKGEGVNKSFTVRRIGANQVGIERIFPLSSPTLKEVEVTRAGMRGIRQSKLYYIREKSKREIDKIYSRAAIRNNSKSVIEKSKSEKKKKSIKKSSRKQASKK